jgi:hypothetical protein
MPFVVPHSEGGRESRAEPAVPIRVAGGVSVCVSRCVQCNPFGSNATREDGHSVYQTVKLDALTAVFFLKE